MAGVAHLKPLVTLHLRQLDRRRGELFVTKAGRTRADGVWLSSGKLAVQRDPHDPMALTVVMARGYAHKAGLL